MSFSNLGLMRSLFAHSQTYRQILKLSTVKCITSHASIKTVGTKRFLPQSTTFKASQRFFSNPNSASSLDLEAAISPTQLYDKSLELSCVTQGDPELEKKLRVLCLEHEVLRQEGVRVPRSLTPDQWQQLLEMDSRSKRRKYYKFLFGNEVKKDKDKMRKEQKAKERLERQETTPIEEENSHIKYGLGHNSIMLRVYDTSMNDVYNHNLIRAMQFSQKLVIDCDYDKYMTPQESSNCAKQLMIAFSENRFHKDPFNLYLCNANKNGPTIKQLHKFIPNLYEDYFPLNVCEQSYLDMFPLQDIVYLTPHCRTELTEFDHDAVYVVGAMVDRSNSEPLSLAKAKREGLRMAKLPLDRYLQWGGGSGKSLTINQMLLIMLEARLSGDWARALAYVPRRKIVSDEAFTSQPGPFLARDQRWTGKSRRYARR